MSGTNVLTFKLFSNDREEAEDIKSMLEEENINYTVVKDGNLIKIYGKIYNPTRNQINKLRRIVESTQYEFMQKYNEISDLIDRLNNYPLSPRLRRYLPVPERRQLDHD